MSEFDRSLQKALVHEGGFVNHPDDPGGATNKGVIQRTYDTFRTSMHLVKRSVKLITDEEVRAIYKREYWDRIQGDKLAPGVSYVVFDGAINSGVSQSVKWLQRALKEMGLYTGLIDGQLGQGTRVAAAGVNDNDLLVARIIKRREAFLRALKTFKTFGRGWLSRIRDVLAVGQAWATGSVGPEVTFSPGGDAKAFFKDAVSSPNVGAGDALAGAGAGSTGIGGMLKGAQEQLSPLAGAGNFIDQAVAVLVVAGLAVGVGGYAWRWYAKKRRDERADALDIAPSAA